MLWKQTLARWERWVVGSSENVEASQKNHPAAQALGVQRFQANGEEVPAPNLKLPVEVVNYRKVYSTSSQSIRYLPKGICPLASPVRGI